MASSPLKLRRPRPESVEAPRSDPEPAGQTEAARAVPLSRMDRRIERPGPTREQLLAAGAILLIGAAGVFAYVRYGLSRSASVPADRVVLSTVSSGEFLDYIPVTASVEPRETVYLDAVDGGQVAEVMTEEGAFVKAGQPIARLANANLQLQVLNSEAQLSEQLDRLANSKLQFAQSRLTHNRELIEARFQMGESQQKLARLTALQGTGVIRRADVEDAQLELDRARALLAAEQQAEREDEALQNNQIRQLDQTVTGLNRNLELARKNLDNLVIKAPFDGELTLLDAHLGESKRQGQRVGQVDRTDGFKAVALIDEHYLPRVTIGEHATSEAEGGAPARPLTVTKVYPQVTDRQFKVDLAFDDHAASALRRGQTLQLRLDIGGQRKSLVVGNGPFYDDSGGQWAFVLAPGSRTANRRAVQLGRRNLEQVEVLQGLEPGERLITSSYESFKNADRIDLSGSTP